MPKILGLVKRFFVKLRFWKKRNNRNKPSESVINTFYSKEVLENAQAFVPMFDKAVQADKMEEGTVIQWVKFTSFNQDRCTCCGRIIPEGRQVCPHCLVCAGENKKEDKHENTC